MHYKCSLLYLMLAGLLVLSACNTPDQLPGSFTYATLPANGDAAAGQALFQAGTLNATACSACHVVDPSPLESGPSLVGIATRAAAGWPGHSAAEYLFRAIVYPNAHGISGYSSGLMPITYGEKLQPQQIKDLIAYLLTLN